MHMSQSHSINLLLLTGGFSPVPDDVPKDMPVPNAKPKADTPEPEPKEEPDAEPDAEPDLPVSNTEPEADAKAVTDDTPKDVLLPHTDPDVEPNAN